MTDYIIHGQTLTDIADGIRAKNPNVTGLIDPVNMKSNILSIPSGSVPYSPSMFLVTESLPATLTNEAIYLIPNGGQIFPDLTTVCSDLPDPSPTVSLMHYVIVTCDYTYQDYRTERVTLADLANITKFWLFDGERSRANTRYTIGEDITYGTSSRMTPPPHIYEYDTEHPELGWVDITAEVTQADWEAGVRPRHTTPTIVFSNFDIFRNSAGTEMYTQRYSICNKYGKAIRTGDVSTYDIYYVDNGVAVNKGYKKTISELYTMLINGQITPTPVSLMSPQEETPSEEENPVEEETIEEQTDEVVEQNNESVENVSELDA